MAFLVRTLNDWYSFISGPAVIAAALLMYCNWGRRLTERQRWIPVLLIVMSVILIGADIVVRNPQWYAPNLELTVHKTISNQIVVLDDHDYEYCKFDHVTFEYNGGRYKFTDNQVIGVPNFTTRDKNIGRGWTLLGKMGVLAINILDENNKPISSGAEWK